MRLLRREPRSWCEALKSSEKIIMKSIEYQIMVQDEVARRERR